MAKIDAYLRSIERLGATGALLTSGQAVTLRFPSGDRNATQVTPHDQLVGLVREVAPPAALAQIDQSRPTRFELSSEGNRYMLDVLPRPSGWQVGIQGVAPAAPAPAATAAPARIARAQSAPVVAGEGEMAIERGQYDDGATAVTSASGSTFLDQLTSAARSARATDVYLATGAAPAMRTPDGLQPLGDRGPLDAETISRELGTVATPEARAAWHERGTATFGYGDGMGRVRATLTRDLRGPGAALRLLAGEPPAIERLGIAREISGWLDARGLVVVAGAAGCGKTTLLAALVRGAGERHRHVVTLEDPIEILQAGSPWISQREVGAHVAGIAPGVAAASREGADVIVLGSVGSEEAAGAIVEAVAAGHLVLTTISAGAVHGTPALEALYAYLAADRREPARALLERALLGVISPVLGAGGRSYEVTAAGRGHPR